MENNIEKFGVKWVLWFQRSTLMKLHFWFSVFKKHINTGTLSIYLLNYWSRLLDRVCNHNSRLAFLSGEPYEFLWDISYCRLTQAPPTHIHTIHKQNLYVICTICKAKNTSITKNSTSKLRFSEPFSVKQWTVKKSNPQSLLYLGLPISPDNWDVIHYKLMTLWKRSIINANCYALHCSFVCHL